MISHDSVICPFCKKEMGTTKVLGSTGLVNYSGYEDKTMVCDNCKKEFYCDVKIQYTFKTRKKY